MLERLFPQQADDKLFVEDVFSTWLYTGNSSTQTITNGIDLAGKGGMVWLKARNSAQNHFLFDTNRGVQKRLVSNSTAEQFELSDGLSAFNSNGFTLGSGYTANGSGLNVASWTFRKAAKFFDVVTYTGNGSTQTIAHSLGVAPGFILVKPLAAGEWHGYHRSLGATQDIQINYDGPAFTFTCWDNTEPTSTNFTVKTNINSNGATYVAYLFAHDPSADGFIQCGSYTGNGSSNGPTVTLGWEPQWLLFKRANSSSGWYLIDNMRGMALTGNGNSLYPNLAWAENSYWATNFANINATGFQIVNTDGDINSSGSNYIYVAIRRGPMRTPTLGTSVFNAQANLSTDANKITTGFVTDWFWERGAYNASGNSFQCSQRLTQTALTFSSTAAEGGPYGAPYLMFDYNDGFLSNLAGNISPGLMYGFRRAPGFMDVVCYTGNGSTSQTVNHNLGVEPELIILKCRNVSNDGGATNGSIWNVAVKAGSTAIHFAIVGSQGLNFNGASTWSEPWVNIFATATSFRPYSITGAFTTTPAGATSGNTYVSYLFASVPGVSKVGSYTGNGSSQTINCGFTNGARFILIKRTDSAGNWCVWDSARGIVTGDDPVLSLNNNFAQDNTTDDVDPHSTGFIVNSVSPGREINLNGSTYIYLAIA